MKASEAYRIMYTLSKRRAVDAGSKDISYLKEKGLIEALPHDEYIEIHRANTRFARAKKKIEGLQGVIKSCEKESDEIYARLGSRWHRAKTSCDLIIDEVRRYIELETKIKDNEYEIGAAEIEINRVETRTGDSEGYVKFKKRYIRLTDDGKKMLEQLDARQATLEDTSYAKFEKQLAK